MVDPSPKQNRKRIAAVKTQRRFDSARNPKYRMLPKFWRVTGGWNDSVVSVFSALSPLVTLWIVAFHFGRPLVGLLLMPVGWILGMFAGFCIVGVLCHFFAVEDAT